MAEVNELYKGILEEDWCPFNPADNSLRSFYLKFNAASWPCKMINDYLELRLPRPLASQ